MTRALALAVLLAACGGKHAAPATEKPPEAPMPPELASFHDVLAPRWHAAQGPERMKDTCDAVPELHTRAEAIATATPPTTANADTWTTATKALVDAVAELSATCTANDAAQFEPAFAKVHESFEGLAAAAGVHHGGDEPKMEP
jgi:hypothetical protein